MKNLLANVVKSNFIVTQIRIYFIFTRLKKFLGSKFGTHKSMPLSDSQTLGFQKAVKKILNDERLFSKFRSLTAFRIILEHVSWRLGQKYSRKIANDEKMAKELIFQVLNQDIFCKPTKYYFRDLGKANPTTLRYLAVGSDLLNFFGNQTKISSIIEVGTGFGGQFLICDVLFELQSYTMYDLPEVQELNRRYIGLFDYNAQLKFGDIDNVEAHDFDLFLSNYAFSELPRKVQLEYLEKIMCRSKHGYVTMNSGLKNSTGRSFGKLSAEEILSRIPGARILDENPLSGPDNYLIVW